MPAAHSLASVDPTHWPRLALRALGAQAALLVRTDVEAAEGAPELHRVLRGVLRHAQAAGAEHAADGCLAAPLRNARGTAVGALGVAAPGRAWTPEDAALLHDLASGASAEGIAVEAVEAVRDSEERFRAIFARAAIGVLVVDMGGRILQTNLAFRRMVRMSSRELRRMHFYELNHPDDNAANLPLFRDLVEGRREAYQMEKRYRLRDGSVVWCTWPPPSSATARGARASAWPWWRTSPSARRWRRACVCPPGRHRGPLWRRRVRAPAGRRGRRGRGRPPRGRDPGRPGRAGGPGWIRGVHQRQHRHCAGGGGRNAAAGAPAARRGRRHVPRPGAGRGAARRLRPQHAHRGAAPPAAGDGAAPGGGPRRVPRLLPAGGGAGDGTHPRVGGAGALGASGARQRGPGRVHRRGGGHGAHRPPGAVGAGAGVPAAARGRTRGRARSRSSSA